jgi:taurine dioxygenase
MPAASGIEVILSGAPLGAEILGVDLAEEMDDWTFHAVDAAYNAYTVIVFRNQQFTPAQHLRFARRFGTLEISPRTQFALPGYPEILRLSNILDADGQPIGNADARRTWHTDLSYTATPPRGSLLYAVEVPTNERGEALGDTLFVSTTAAYDALPAARQQQLQGLRAMHRAAVKQYAPGSQLAEKESG